MEHSLLSWTHGEKYHHHKLNRVFPLVVKILYRASKACSLPKCFFSHANYMHLEALFKRGGRGEKGARRVAGLADVFGLRVAWEKKRMGWEASVFFQ